MIDFWLLVALLAVSALLFLWWPLITRKVGPKISSGARVQLSADSRQSLNMQAFDSQSAELQEELQAGRLEQGQYAALQTELQRNLLGDVSTQSAVLPSASAPKGSGLTALLFSVAVLFGGLGLYLNLGSSATLQQMAAKDSFAQQLATAAPEQRLLLLEAESRHDPQDADVWYALANVYFQRQRFEDSINAYQRLLSLVGEQPGLLAEIAQALFFIQGNRVTAEVKDLAERALRIQPDNVSALGLLGIEAFAAERYSQAIEAWQTALEVAPDAQGSEALRQGIVRAQQLLAAAPTSPRAQTVAASLTLQVSIDKELRLQLKPETAVFVLAKAINGSPMPLAVQRLQVKDLPSEVILNDGMAMTAALKLSSVQQVEVLARVSLSGQPLPQTGDLQGRFGPVNVNDQQAPIRLVIDQIIP
jgi:cytochrome c-type biogenesis protein CcmH